MRGNTRPQTAGARTVARPSSALELARDARISWQRSRDDALHFAFEAQGEYCRSERFYDASQRTASMSRCLGHANDTIGSSAKLRRPMSASLVSSSTSATRLHHSAAANEVIDASIFSSVMLPRSPGASSFFSATSATPLLATLPPSDHAQLEGGMLRIDAGSGTLGELSPEEAVSRAQRENTARSNILETLTMADSSGPPLKQTIGLSSFAQLLRDHHHQAHALEPTAGLNRSAAGENDEPTVEPSRLFHQRPASAQPRPASSPPLNCFRPWSSKPLRPYQDPLLQLKRPETAGASTSTSGKQISKTIVGYNSTVSGNTLARAADSKGKDYLSTLLKQQAADVTRRADLRVSYRANMDALRQRQENLENVLIHIAEARGF